MMNSKRKKIVAVAVVLVVLVLVSTLFLVQYVNSSNAEPEPDRLARVACLGDSITNRTAYTGDLQALLTNSSVVGNFGVESATVLFESNKPYYFEPTFREARVFAPTTVVILLGTNDAHDDIYQKIDNFVANYERLIARTQAWSSKPQVFLVEPPPVFNNTLGINGTDFSAGVIPRVQQVANQLHLPLIDVYTPLLNHPEYFPDGIHPNSQGAQVIADAVYKAITAK